jgi:4-aminobutyrate aminotransferase/(S)-3-amino-2-methylpropionate transaminase
VQTAQSRNEALARARGSSVSRGVGSAYPIFAERAEGVRLWDVDGNEYLDFAAGIGTLNLGHRHPRIVAAIRDQLDHFTHTCFQVVQYGGYVELASRLCDLIPGEFAKKALFLSTGAEAVENAVKIARHATGRPGVVTFHYGYHGRTLLTLTMTGKVSPYTQDFGPWAPDVYQAPYPYELLGWSCERALAALAELFDTQVSPQRVAAIVIEPVLGEGGFVPAPVEFLRELRRIADRNGIVLVADEVQTGFGRTAKMFAIEHSGVVPDMVVVAKSIAGGLPLAGVLGRADLMDAVDPGGLGGTYAGNPLACAAALATLDAFEAEDILGRARRLGERLRAFLETLARRHSQMVEVRGLGAMLAVEFTDAPADELGRNLAKRIVDDACSRGLILLTAGPKGKTIRFLVPLVASDDELDSGLARFEQSCAAVLGA